MILPVVDVSHRKEQRKKERRRGEGVPLSMHIDSWSSPTTGNCFASRTYGSVGGTSSM